MNQELENKKTESVFSNKNFVLLFMGTLVSRFGDIIFSFAMSWYILELTKSALAQGIYIAIGMITMILLQMIGGIVADRFNKIKIIYSTDFLRGISLILCFICLIFASNINIKIFNQNIIISETNIRIIILYISSFLLSVFGAFFGPASNALVPKVVKEEQFQQAQSLFSIIINVNNIIGLLCGAMLYAFIGPNLIFILNAISYILSGISEMFIHIEDEENKEDLEYKKLTKNILTDFKEGINYIKKDIVLQKLMIFAVLINFFMLPLFLSFPQFLFNQILNTSTLEFSITEVFYSVAAIISALLLSFLKQSEKVYNHLKYGTFGYILTSALTLGLFFGVAEKNMPFIIFLISFSLTMFLLGMLNTFVNIPLNIVFLKRIDKQLFGRVITIFGTFIGIANPISIILFGSLIDNIGLINSMIICVLGLLMGLFYILFKKQLKEI